MPEDPYRQLRESHQLAIKVESLMREEAVVNYYAARGNRVICQDEDQTRQVFGIRGKAADVVVEVSPTRAIIAEVKGSDVAHALKQLRATLPFVQNRYPFVSCKIFVRNATPVDDTVEIDGEYKASRVFYRSFPGEWLLMEYLPDRSTQWVEIGSEIVSIIFGPHL
jgi:hypothetical protein